MKKALLMLMLFPMLSFGATITRYVNTGSTAGGNGTTNATTGDNRAYPDPATGEAAEQTDLVAAGNIIDFECSGTLPITALTTVDGWTTSTTCYISFVGDWRMPESGNPWDATKFRHDSAALIYNITECVHLEYMQFSSSYTGNGWIFPTGTPDLTIKNCIFRGGTQTTPEDNWAIFTNGSPSTTTIINCLFYDFPTVNTSMRVIWTNSTGHIFNFFNNTMVGGYYFWRAIVVNAYNNIIQGAVDCCLNVTFLNEDGNIANTSEFSGASSHNSVSVSFFNAEGKDYHLSSTDTYALDGGVSDPGSGLYSTDIDGDTRSGTWDIGADEYVSAEPPVVIDEGWIPQVIIFGW